MSTTPPLDSATVNGAGQRTHVPGWHVSTPTADTSDTATGAGPRPTQPPTGVRPRPGLGPGHRTPTPAISGAPTTGREPVSSPAPTPAPAPSVMVTPTPAPGAAGVPVWVQAATTTAVVIVALVAAVVSYEHMRHVAAEAGEGWRSWLIPLSVDGLLVAASMVMLTRRRQGRPAGALAWGSLLLGIAASVAANVAAADTTLIARLVAAWSPVALLLAVELLLQLFDHRPPAATRTRTGATGEGQDR